MESRVVMETSVAVATLVDTNMSSYLEVIMMAVHAGTICLHHSCYGDKYSGNHTSGQLF